VAIFPDGSKIVSGSIDGTIKIWDLVTRECIKILEEDAGYVREGAVLIDGSTYLSSSDDSTQIWDIKYDNLSGVGNNKDRHCNG